MFQYGALWGVVTILGPLLLLAAMAYAVTAWRRRGPAAKQETEEAMRALYREGGQRDRRQGAEEAPIDSPPLVPGAPPRKRSSVKR